MRSPSFPNVAFACRGLAIALSIFATACPAMAAPQAAPSPAKPVTIQRYLGRWYEIARLHNMLEDGCASATAEYRQNAEGRITAVETCNKAAGGSKVWRAGAHILDPGGNAKMRLSFLPFVSKDYWVLDHADDYAWAIVGTPEGKYLWLFARQPQIPPAEKAAMVERARALGYNTSALIYDR